MRPSATLLIYFTPWWSHDNLGQGKRGGQLYKCFCVRRGCNVWPSGPTVPTQVIVQPVVWNLEAVVIGKVTGELQGPVPCFQEHALQLQLAVALYVWLMEPHGQVGQDEVAVSSVGQLSTNGVLQEELLLVCTGELVGDLICNRPGTVAA